jgi:hypothetical protein
VSQASDGTFVVTDAGTDLGFPLRLRVSAPGCQAVDPIPFERGARDLRVVLQAGARFAARLLADDWLWRRLGDDDLNIYLRDDAQHSVWLVPRLVDGSWLLTTNACAPGKWKLTIESEVPLVEIEGILLGPSAQADSRLDPIDLRQRLQLFEVRTMDAAGQPVTASGEVHVRDPRTKQWDYQSWLENGVAELVLPREPIDVYLQTDDHVPMLRSGVMDRAEFVLAARPRVRLRLDGMPKLRADAPIEIGVSAADGWAQQRELPESASPVQMVDLDRENWIISLLLCEAARCEVIFVNTETNNVTLAKVPCSLSPETAEARITVPPAVVAKLAPWLAGR